MSQRYFLLIRDRHAGTTVVREFGGQRDAVSAYNEAERENHREIMGTDPRLEIVLIGGENVDEVRRAYPHYFTEGERRERRRQMLRDLSKLAHA